jgi:lipase chaperone LimK
MSHSRTALVAALCCSGFAASAVLPQFGNHAASSQVLRLAVPPTPATAPDFAALEKAFARIAVDAGGNPRLSSATEAALLEAFAALPEATPHSEQQVPALIRNSFPGTGEGELARLFDRYRCYRQAELAHRGTSSPDSLGAELAQLDANMALRRRCFSEMQAEQLFGRQELLARHLLELRQLEDTPGLSSADKAIRRTELQRGYEQRRRALGD